MHKQNLNNERWERPIVDCSWKGSMVSRAQGVQRQLGIKSMQQQSSSCLSVCLVACLATNNAWRWRQASRLISLVSRPGFLAQVKPIVQAHPSQQAHHSCASKPKHICDFVWWAFVLGQWALQHKLSTNNITNKKVSFKYQGLLKLPLRVQRFCWRKYIKS